MTDGYTAVDLLAKSIEDDVRVSGYEVLKYERPAAHSGNYIVVNFTDFPEEPDEEVQIGTLNVNVHTVDTVRGECSDLAQLRAVVRKIKDFFKPNRTLGELIFEPISSSSVIADSDETHYVNIRFNVYNFI